jgi:hypothetical protein
MGTCVKTTMSKQVSAQAAPPFLFDCGRDSFAEKAEGKKNSEKGEEPVAS